ncbi:uncharacterized protein LAJ45_03076 [Morchella importuna]|uniref:uncharacterized protein n=1 Tax=Morchella importuna TaxID=1174673 RepID=UPI001E8CE3AF|nr:uncharacterized protein LAJ45_03076 [Morchella importuna]KAH8152850.1 hypothetical protein LAJ45_03076 [Morchella importuna]
MESLPQWGGLPRLAVCWPDCDAKTVHVTFASSDWSLPGIELNRQPDGEFLLFLGEYKHAGKIYFKFIIDGTLWKVNPQFPVVTDELGIDNNCWAPEEATEYHDSCEKRLRRKLTLMNINREALCEFALSIHGSVDGYGRQIECVIDENGPTRTCSTLSMSGSWSEIVFLRFQPVKGGVYLSSPDDKSLEELEEGNSCPAREMAGGILDKIYVNEKEEEEEIWVAKFPTDFNHKMLPYKPLKTYNHSERELLMESECATLRFLNQHTRVPAPQIYAYDVRYTLVSGGETEIKIESPDLQSNSWKPITGNRIGWPFILLGDLGGTPSWLPLDNFLKEPLLPNDPSDSRLMTWKQVMMYRMELAEHPLSACGYLTLNTFFWQVKKGPNSRKIRTTKAEFGIRPCIYDRCKPFTHSIVAAFNVPPGDRHFPPISSIRSLDSITAYYRHLLNHGFVRGIDEFVALWQMKAMLYELFSSRYEYGPFILQYPDISRHNIIVSGHLFDWERTKAMPIQTAICPPRMCFFSDWYESGPIEVLARYKAECPDIMKLLAVTHANDDQPNILGGVRFCTKERFLSIISEEKLLFPIVLLEETCKDHPALIGKIALKNLPMMFLSVRGYEWESVKEASMQKGALRFVLQDWVEEQRVSKSF